MKVILALALLLAVSYADMNCWYTSPSSNAVYSLEDLALTANHWMNTTDILGNNWYWKVCDDGSEDPNPLCGEDSSICMEDSNGIHNRGSTSTAQWADIQNDDTGLTVIFSADDTCNEGEPIKTVINYICSEDYDDIQLNEDGVYITIDNAKTCFVTVNVYTEEACAESSVPEDGQYDGNNYYDGNWDVHHSSSYGLVFTPFLTFGLLLTITVLFTCLCCCCMIRRRRRCQNKAIAMKQFSNIAFQPIPSTHSTINKAQPTSQFVNIPSYNPYVTQQNQQPQYVYYYPDQQQNVVPLENFNQDSQVVSDEQLAKELQSQFDRERV